LLQLQHLLKNIFVEKEKVWKKARLDRYDGETLHFFLLVQKEVEKEKARLRGTRHLCPP